MPRPRNITPTRKLEVAIPQDVALRLELFLTSGLDGKVPFAAYQTFFVARIKEFFDTRALDISEAFCAEPGTHVVKATPTTITALTQLLEHS